MLIDQQNVSRLPIIHSGLSPPFDMLTFFWNLDFIFGDEMQLHNVRRVASSRLSGGYKQMSAIATDTGSSKNAGLILEMP